MPRKKKVSKDEADGLLGLLRAAATVEQKVADLPRGDDFQVLVRLVKAYVSGSYREVPWMTITLIATGLLYLINPMDAVPDMLPLVGFTDDAAVLAAIIESIGADMQRFRIWERKHTRGRKPP